MSLQNKNIAFIGAGNMGEALIRGLIAAKAVEPSQLIATDVRPDRLATLAKVFGIRTATGNAQAVAQADVVVLAVKPQQMSEVLTSFRDEVGDHRLIVTIAAGISTARIERELAGDPHVIRVMPNTAALVGAGAAALCKGAFATDEDLATAEEILAAVGVTVKVDESHLDLVTAISGSGPAYFFYLAEALIKVGIAEGLSEDAARKLTVQTLLGSGKLLVETGETPESLRAKVTSPAGTTEAAIKTLQHGQFVEIVSDAVRAAAKRGRELSGE